jgi:hypothetical protein
LIIRANLFLQSFTTYCGSNFELFCNRSNRLALNRLLYCAFSLPFGSIDLRRLTATVTCPSIVKIRLSHKLGAADSLTSVTPVFREVSTQRLIVSTWAPPHVLIPMLRRKAKKYQHELSVRR